MFDELDDRQKLLGGVTLLLILVHLFFPAAGVDDTSAVLLTILAIVLYGREIGRALRAGLRLALEAPRRSAAADTAAAPPPAGAAPVEVAPGALSRESSALADRIRQLSYQVEHARVAAATDGLLPSSPAGEIAADLAQRAGGQARVALTLAWGALEQRLHAATGVADAVAAARRLVEGGRAPRQFAEALEAYRRLRNEVTQSVDGGVTDDALWALVDVGAALAALVPSEPTPS